MPPIIHAPKGSMFMLMMLVIYVCYFIKFKKGNVGLGIALQHAILLAASAISLLFVK